jgi:hypothetical protein
MLTKNGKAVAIGFSCYLKFFEDIKMLKTVNLLSAIELPKAAGQIPSNKITLELLITLGTAGTHMYKGQRDHGKNNRRKNHTKGVLKGNSQVFSAVWVKSLKRLLLIDGYHRVDSLAKGLASFEPGADIRLDVYYAGSLAEVGGLYDQFNSAAAAKKSQCYFSSGLRACEELDNIVAPHFTKGPKAMAAQYAAGMKGTIATKDAVIKVIKGIRVVNDLDLPRSRHEIGGVIGAYVAIAQYCNDKRLVSTFIRSINGNICDFDAPTKAELVLMGYHQQLKDMKGGSKTGGSLNDSMFSRGLAAFAKFAVASRNKRGVAVQENMTLAQFVELMRVKFA